MTTTDNGPEKGQYKDPDKDRNKDPGRNEQQDLDHWALENSIAYLSRIAFRSFATLTEKQTLSHGVSAGQWRFLRQLWREEGLTQRELSNRVGMREPTTVVALKSLEKAGLVRREPSTVDRRKMHVYLTDKAKALEPLLIPISAKVHELATRGFTDDEVETLRALLRRLIDNLAEETRGLPCPGEIPA